MNDGSRALPGWGVGIVAASLMLVFVAQAMVAARRDSVTIDEFLHLPTGLYYLYTGDFRPDPINPPWTRMIAALPLLRHPPAFDAKPGMGGWAMGYVFERQNRKAYHALYQPARAMIVLLACLLATLVFVWSRQLYGDRAALASLFLFAFSPNMLAHGHLVTLDMAGALGFTASAFAVWRLLDRATIGSALLAGAVIGAATLLKLSAFVLGAAVIFCVVLRVLEERPTARFRSAGRWLGLLAVSGLTALLVLNAGYGFEGSMALLSSATLDAKGLLATLAEQHPGLRLPFPRPFVEGVDMVLNVGKQHDPSYFLAGKLSSEGWWYYHLAAFFLKTPIPALLIYLWALAAWLLRRSPGRREYCLLVPVLFIFTANALFNSLQIGVRHVLPVYPLLFVASGPWLARALSRPPSTGGPARWPAVIFTLTGAAWLVVGTLSVAPRYLEYFNEAAGGPAGGYRYLIDSNLDWGQDLIRLRERMQADGDGLINLAYFGRVDPRTYGIRFRPLERGVSHGRTAVSASFVMGRPYFWYRGGRMGWGPSRS